MMSTSQCSGSEGDARENVASPTDRPAEQSVFPPFSGDLNVDEELVLSNENFKQTVDDFFKDKIITPLSQLTATPAFPIPHVLAQFASKAYRDYQRRETDAQYETRLELPVGWKLLTTASNTGKDNGYFGAAYWHPEHQQVVIAHRGTDPTNGGTLWSDVKGVLRNKYVQQMESASTFAYKVVEVLREVNHEKGTNFQVFFTGHSLGGWLAQITTFTTEYLKTEGNTFLKSDNVSQSYHPHTVVFDSPGCKYMLSQMADKLDVRLYGRSFVIEHLDITSYLSAPNRVNTCNAHVGTVYRIFVDLSDMGRQEEDTEMYNLTTHSMDRIVGAFDPKTGQVSRDEQGQLKVRVVVDWPVSTGLSGSEEYESFFKWVNRLDDYHTEIRPEDYLFKGYHPIRYQTRNYDERVTSISIFSQEERQFLEDYRRLCQLPEFFKPKEMFSALGNDQAQEEAVKKLQSFQIVNGTIRCSDASALQALIPYVKRLLLLFPEIKENTKCALSPHEIRNDIYQIGTRRYLEKLHQSPLDFKPDALSLTDFLNSDVQKVLHLRMVDGDAWTGLIKVYQVLQKTPSKTDFHSEGHYTVLTLEHLLLVNQMVSLNALMESTATPHLLMMSCETSQLSYGEAKELFRSLFNILRLKPFVKIILTTQSEDDTVTLLQDMAEQTLSNGFVTRVEQLTWTDLTRRSQEKLLENAVNFQGCRIPLNQLTSPDSPVTNFIPTAQLLGEKHHKIGEEPVPHAECNFYYEKYYIDRTFRHQVFIKQEVLNTNREQNIPDLLASSEKEFKQLCQLNPKRNVHWLETDESGNLVWQQSQGSLGKLRKYIDTDSGHTYTADDLDKLFEKAQEHRVMLISDTSGMGKSIVLRHLSKQIKEKFPAKWVVRIDLNDHTDALKALQKEQIGKEKAIEFVSDKMLKLESGFERELFKQCCEQKQKVNAVILLDGFDEISPNYKETVIDLLQALRQTAVEQLWVASRPHLREELEDKLQQLSYTLEPFSEENQVASVTKFWSLEDWFTGLDGEEKEERRSKLEIYAKLLFDKLAKSTGDKYKQFAGIPLQCRMLAEAFDEEAKIFCESAEWVPELRLKLDLFGLYRKFIERKYGIYQKKKAEPPVSNLHPTRQAERELKSLKKDHQRLALKVLFTEEQVALLTKNSPYLPTFSSQELTSIGIAQESHEGKLHFIHRTFAEYYVAELLVKQLTKGSNTSQQVQDLLLQEIFLEEDYQVLRAFIDGLLSESKQSKEVLKQYGNRISDLCRDGLLTLHQAAREGNAYIVGFVLDSAQAGGHTDTVRELLLAKDKDAHTAWHLAAEGGHVEALQKLLECAKEKLTAEELNDMLLAKTNSEETIWHSASLQGNVEALEKLWVCGKETLTAEELNNKLLLAKDSEEFTAWLLAAEHGNLEVLQKLWQWGKETLTAEELIYTFFIAKDRWGRTAWHCAALYGNVELLQKLWVWGKETLTAEELNNKLLLDKDRLEQTTWHYASRRCKLEVLQKLWEWGKETLTAEELNNKLLLDTDRLGQTAWHYASLNGKLEVLQKLWEWGKETLTAEDRKNELLLAKDNKGRTAWHYASLQGNVEALQKLWEWGKETLTAKELNNELLLAKDSEELTAWHLAAEHGNLEVLQQMWVWGKETLTAEELIDELLLDKDMWGQTAWHYASRYSKIEVLQKLWEWGKETLTAEELKNRFLLDKDSWGQTAWHYASWRGNIEALPKLWEWGKETLKTEELGNIFLLAEDMWEQTAWHYASLQGNVEALQKLWEWGKETLTAEELNTKLLLAKSTDGETAWHLAAKKADTAVLEKLYEWTEDAETDLKFQVFLARNKDGKIALDLVSESKSLTESEKLEVKELLKKCL